MAWAPHLTSHFGRNVAFTPTAIATALVRDSSNGFSFVYAHPPIMVSIYRNDGVYEVTETGDGVQPRKIGAYAGEPIEIYTNKHKSRTDAIAEFMKLVQQPYKLRARQAVGACILIPPRSRRGITRRTQ